MPQPTDFSCSKCRKKYRWKPALAGKRVRCACGNTMQVPAAVQEEQDADLYELAAHADAVALPAPTVVTPVAPLSASSELAYQGRVPVDPARSSSSDQWTDPVRDLYVPAGLLVASFLAAMIWGLTQLHNSAIALVVVTVVVVLFTLVKTAILIGLALIFAGPLGINFGLLRHAILKFAAIIIFVDCARMWMVSVVRSGSGMSHSHTVWLPIGFSAILTAVACRYFFNMDRDDTAKFVLPWVLISIVIDWVLGFLMAAILAAILVGFIVAARGPMPITSTPSVTSSASPSTAPAGNLTAYDRLIDSRLTKQGMLIQEGREWKTTLATDRNTRQLIDQLYALGAAKVYVDSTPRRLPSRQTPPKGQKLYVVLPDSAEQQAACRKAAQDYRVQLGLSPDPLIALPTKKYLVIDPAL